MYFKRDNELIEKVKNVVLANNLNAEQRNSIEKLVSRYESSTYKDWGDRSEFFNDMVDIMVNDFGFDDKGLAEKMANTHPTLQQNFMRMVYMFINNMANKSYYDDRNKNSVEFAKEVKEKVGEKYFSFI